MSGGAVRRDLHAEPFADLGEELAGRVLVKAQLGRQLHKQDRQLFIQDRDLIEEHIQLIRAVDQLPHMRNLLRQLHRKAKGFGHAVAPSLPGRGAIRPMKRAVDLHDRKPRGIALERSPLRRETIRILPRDAPARRTDVQSSHGGGTLEIRKLSGARVPCMARPADRLSRSNGRASPSERARAPARKRSRARAAALRSTWAP